MKYTLEDALRRIEELEKENSELKHKLSAFDGKKPAGRKVHNADWEASYNYFVKEYESGKSITEIADQGKISRRTAYRYKKYYDMNS